MRPLVWLLMLFPVGIHLRDPSAPRATWRGRMFRNRRGGWIIHLGDVVANLGQWWRGTLYRIPTGSAHLRDGDGRIVGSLERDAASRRRLR